MTRAKICGINSVFAYDAAMRAGADWVGFVFFDRSPRVISVSDAATLVRRQPDGPRKVGLFVDPTDMAIEMTLSAVNLDILQIYAPIERARHIRRTFGRPVWHAVGVSKAADLPTEMNGVDGFLIEAKAPQGADRPGGNGAIFDWSIPKNWHAPGFWLLAGGLNPANVTEAIAASGAPAVDVSSGVEHERGLKSSALITAFVKAAHEA